VRRVLREDGTLWLNLGDSYANNGQTGLNDNSSGKSTLGPKRDGLGAKNKAWTRSRPPQTVPLGLKPKDLVGIPWRVAFALQADGWYLRQDIIWHKPSPMPESVTDRCTKAHEYVFLMAKSQRYYYDAEAISEASVEFERTPHRPRVDPANRKGVSVELMDGVSQCGVSETRNRRSVWTVSTKPCKEAHFAVMPPDLAEVCILAGTSAEGCCAACGAPWERVVERERVATRPGTDTKVTGDSMTDGNRDPERHVTDVRTVGWQPTCKCNAAKTPCTVLDPFGGAGTTALVSQLHERDSVICELNEKYAKIAQKRIGKANPMFTQIEVVQ
jgi:DNA modification methylase